MIRALLWLSLPFPVAVQGAASPAFPEHWGPPPQAQTLDHRPLPGGYGFGSSTLARWIQEQLDRDATRGVQVSGEFRQWHTVTLTMDGPAARESDTAPNPFTDFRMTVTWSHESGDARFRVPGYFAADGRAAETSAESGDRWRSHFVPDRPGRWSYLVDFVRGPGIALRSEPGEAVRPFDDREGTLDIGPTDKQAPDLRARGRLHYVGRRYRQFAGDRSWFLKAGPDAPETLLAYADFDGTRPGQRRDARAGEAVPATVLHRYEPHLRDWQTGDPTWKGGLGKGLVGALNYLAGKGLNSVSFLPYNAGGDGDNVWPFVRRDDKLHYDCSKLDQWGIVFDHATRLGLHLHFKLQENEIDDRRVGHARQERDVPEALDGGLLGPERRLYFRELIARFGHALAVTWNLGEENTQSTDEIRAMARFFEEEDPYGHLVVVHTFPDEQERVYRPLLGLRPGLTGVSLQNSWRDAHVRTLQWIRESTRAGRPWVVSHDEQNPAELGVPPDPGYAGHSGEAVAGGRTYTLHDIRKSCLWGTLLAGGAGVEYYFGYRLPQNDLNCEDWRSRDRSWDFCRIALEFFGREKIPIQEMANLDEAVGNPEHSNRVYALAQPGVIYLVYLPQGGIAELDLSGTSGPFTVQWFDPRHGGTLQSGSPSMIEGGAGTRLGPPPSDPTDDWLVVIRRPSTHHPLPTTHSP